MLCKLQGHQFIIVEQFDSDIYQHDGDNETKLGIQQFNLLMCQGCGGTVIEASDDGWTPENKTPRRLIFLYMYIPWN